MPDQVVRYQSDLLRDVVRDAQTYTELSVEDGLTLRQRIDAADSEQELAELWEELDEYGVLDEGQWGR